MEENKKSTGKAGALHGKRKGHIRRTIVIVMVFALGLGIFSYPIISNLIYERAARRVIQNFDVSAAKIEDAEIKKKLNLAYAYNDYLSGVTDVGVLKDPYTKEEIAAGAKEYARMLEVNEQIGHIVIPKISLDAPLYAGTSEKVLQKGIGHMEGTSLPVGGNYTHAVLTGHRGLPTANLFTELDKLEIGDKFYIKNIGGTLAYKVDQIKIVEPTDFSDLAIVPGHDYVTLLTCTPYMINSHRLLVRGYRIEYVEAVMEKEISDNNTNNMYRNLFFVTLAILIALLVYILLGHLKSRRMAKTQEGIGAFHGEKKETD
jgi:LPXTG-site transpeptidase (sortase) family protein